MKHKAHSRMKSLVFLLMTGCAIALFSTAIDCTNAFANEASQRLLEKGRSLFDQGDTKQAAFLLEQAVIADPADPQPRFWLGRSYWQNEEFIKSQRAFNQAISIEPAYKSALYWGGLADLEQDDRKSAEEKYTTLEKVCGDCEEALELRAAIDEPEEDPFLDLFSESNGESDGSDDGTAESSE